MDPGRRDRLAHPSDLTFSCQKARMKKQCSPPSAGAMNNSDKDRTMSMKSADVLVPFARRHDRASRPGALLMRARAPQSRKCKLTPRFSRDNPHEPTPPPSLRRLVCAGKAPANAPDEHTRAPSPHGG